MNARIVELLDNLPCERGVEAVVVGDLDEFVDKYNKVVDTIDTVYVAKINPSDSKIIKGNIESFKKGFENIGKDAVGAISNDHIFCHDPEPFRQLTAQRRTGRFRVEVHALHGGLHGFHCLGRRAQVVLIAAQDGRAVQSHASKNILYGFSWLVALQLIDMFGYVDHESGNVYIFL